MPESQVTEWKATWRDEYLRWLCGFANAEGGTLTIGKDDKGKIVGVENAQRLLMKHPSEPPNPALAQVFFRTGLIEAWGRGYERIMDACREAGTTLPTVRHDGAGLWIEWEWVPPEEGTPQVTPPVTGGELESELGSELESDSLVGRVLAALQETARGKAGISAALGQKQVSGPLHEVVRKLVEERFVEMTLPNKPNSRLQKYRLTESGRALLKRLKS